MLVVDLLSLCMLVLPSWCGVVRPQAIRLAELLIELMPAEQVELWAAAAAPCLQQLCIAMLQAKEGKRESILAAYALTWSRLFAHVSA